MVTDRETFASLSLDELADRMATGKPGSTISHTALSEFTRRQTVAQQEAASAQAVAAEATRRSARYMLVSGIAVAVSFVITTALAAINLWLNLPN